MPDGDRIAKLMARAGAGSRREVERMIADGRVALNGETLASPALNLQSLKGVTLDGRPIGKPERTRLWAMHKPTGCLTTERDPKGRPTIFDLLPREMPRVSTVGRLDYNTEGLLLLTNDGELKRALELPKNSVQRRYRVRVFGEPRQGELERLAEGITVDGVRYRSIDANVDRRTGRHAWLSLALTEGKNREVRKVLDHLGLQVARLIRVGFGPFELGDLKPKQVVALPANAAEQAREAIRDARSTADS